MMQRLRDAFARARTNDSGVSAIELFTVVIIVGIVAAIAFPTFKTQRERAQYGNLQANARNLGAQMNSAIGTVSTNGVAFNVVPTCRATPPGGSCPGATGAVVPGSPPQIGGVTPNFGGQDLDNLQTTAPELYTELTRNGTGRAGAFGINENVYGGIILGGGYFDGGRHAGAIPTRWKNGEFCIYLVNRDTFGHVFSSDPATAQAEIASPEIAEMLGKSMVVYDSSRGGLQPKGTTTCQV
jgi:type II secretory pathway pseudopilin PulG